MAAVPAACDDAPPAAAAAAASLLMSMDYSSSTRNVDDRDDARKQDERTTTTRLALAFAVVRSRQAAAHEAAHEVLKWKRKVRTCLTTTNNGDRDIKPRR